MIRTVKAKKVGLYSLALGALGVVFGDIGTSPLYAFKAVLAHNPAGYFNIVLIYGLVSLVIWSIILVVSVKYLGFIMRANNKGEGGSMALTALMTNATSSPRVKFLLILLGVAGVSLFYGDSVITPAISVLSAVEGLQLVAPGLQGFIIPITVISLIGLFLLQRKGTTVLGKLFGPVMFVWFTTMAIGGIGQIMLHPEVLSVLSPAYALSFIMDSPGIAFIAMGTVVLAITGTEALYADMGHFGRKPIAMVWFWLVFPALILNYMGQAALINGNSAMLASPFFLMFPEQLYIPLIILATLATLIASQAVISGAFSLTHQAVQLKFLPHLITRHTSDKQYGQIYVPFVNWTLLVLVVILVITFGSSTNLASAYGIAVSGTLTIDTILFLAVARIIWKASWAKILLGTLCFLTIDLIFVIANLPRIPLGGWFPIALALIVFAIIYTWIQGQKVVTKERLEVEGKLEHFVRQLQKSDDIKRVPGSTIYLSHHHSYTPLALRATVDRLHELSEHVLIVNLQTKSVPHVPESERISFDNLGFQNDGISHITLSFGFKDSPNVPRALHDAHWIDKELDFNLREASYVVSHLNVVRAKRRNLPLWQKLIYILMSKNAATQADYYKLPLERTVEMSSFVKL